MTKKSTATVKAAAKGKVRSPATKAKDRQLAIKDNVTMAVSMAPVTNSRHIKRRSGKVTRVVKTERITGSVPLGAEAMDIQINPGRSTTFPYLSGIANLYSKYRFRKVKLSYTPQVPTTQSGTLTIGFDYDSVLGLTPTPEVLAQLEDFATTPVWCAIDVTIDCPTDYRYVKSVTPLENIDLYDIGAFYVMSEATGTLTTSPGYFTISYEVELIHPQPVGSQSSNPVSVQFERMILSSNSVAPYPSVDCSDHFDVTTAIPLWGSTSGGGLDMSLYDHFLPAGQEPAMAWDPVSQTLSLNSKGVLTVSGTFWLQEDDWAPGTSCNWIMYWMNSANHIQVEMSSGDLYQGTTLTIGSVCSINMTITNGSADTVSGLAPHLIFHNVSAGSDVLIQPKQPTSSLGVFNGEWVLSFLRS